MWRCDAGARRLAVGLFLLLVAPRSAAQPQRTAEAEAATQMRIPVLEIVLCEAEPERFKFTVYDRRVLPTQRVLPKYLLMAAGKTTGRLSSKNEPCPGGNGTPVFSSEALQQNPVRAADGAGHLWVIELKLSDAGYIHPITLIREDAPSRTTILYHPETKRYCIRGWEKGCEIPEGAE